MPRTLILSGADQPYADLLVDLFDSVRAHPELNDCELGALDLGLAPEARAALAARGVRLVRPGWDILTPAVEQAPAWYRAMTARPFLPRHFPGWDVYVWLDSDTWVQDPLCVTLYRQGALDYGFAISAELSRCYATFFGSTVRDLHHDAYCQAFGADLARTLITYPILNSGAFGARADSPVWERWQILCAAAMEHTAGKLTEQAALNAAIYGLEMRGVHLLPAEDNWICGVAPPMWDPARRCLVEPALPHAPLRLVHLTNLKQPQAVACVGGGTITTSYRYRDLRRLTEAHTGQGRFDSLHS